MAAAFMALLALVVPSSGVAQATDRPLALSVTPVYRLGGLDAPEWAAFVDVRDVAFGGSGDLWVVDTRGAQVVRVAPDGRSGRNLVRRGRGPGEFQAPAGIAALPDGRALVGDLVNGAWQLLGPDGGLIASTKADGDLRAIDVRWLNGSTFVAVPSLFWTGDGRARIHTARGMAVVEDVPLLRFTVPPAADAPSKVARARYTQPPASDVPFKSHAFQVRPLWDVQRGRIALLDGAAYDVRLLDAAGATTGSITRPIAPRRPTREDMRAAREQARARLIRADGTPNVGGAFSGGGGAGGTRNAPEVLRRIEAGLAAMTFAEHVPVVQDLRFDAAGRLWVARTPPRWGDPPLLDVFSPAGAYLGTTRAFTRLPDAFGPDDRAAFVEKDDLDAAVVRVVRYRIDSPREP